MVQELREICRRREVFLDEVKKIHGYAQASPFRREISEIVQDSKERSEQEAETDLEVEAGNVPFRAMERNAVTADGSPQRIVGWI